MRAKCARCGFSLLEFHAACRLCGQGRSKVKQEGNSLPPLRSLAGVGTQAKRAGTAAVAVVTVAAVLAFAVSTSATNRASEEVRASGKATAIAVQEKTRIPAATSTAEAALALASVIAQQEADAEERWTAANDYLAAGDQGLALVAFDQAAAIAPLSPRISSERRAAQSTVSASATATAVPPTAIPPATPDRRWAAFLDYAPRLTDLIRRSDLINTASARAAEVVTLSTAPLFYTLADTAARNTGLLKDQALIMNVPREAYEFREAVAWALILREESFNKLKAALDSPLVSNRAAYNSAKALADTSVFDVTISLLKLCEILNATTAECLSAARMVN